ncbi:MAG: MFS transporter [Bacteroides uniformis]|nr:MFS transporter [Bacteroides uniformis]
MVLVQNAYVIAFGGFLLLGGRMSDAFGRRSILSAALVVFGIGSVGTGWHLRNTQSSFPFCSRSGAALMAPAALALIMDYFTGQKLVKAVAWYSSVSGIGMCFGLLVGGTVTDLLSWRYGFS